VELRAQRFALIPVLLLGTAFSVLAPLFWTHVESPGSGGAAGHENLELYGRTVPGLEYGVRRIQGGEWPLWAGDQYCGIPYFANPAHGLLQPLNVVFFLAPVPVGLALHAFFGLLLLGVFMALYLRALGTGYLAAAIGGMALAFGGCSAAAMSRPELLGVLVWTPLLYWVMFEYAEAPRGLYVVLGGAVTALMAAAGTPILALALAGSAYLYGALRAIWVRRIPGPPLIRRLGALALMAALGGALSAVQWLPYALWAAALAAPSEAIWPWNWSGLAPTTALELARAFLLPGHGTLPDMLYVGVISLVLIPAAILRRHGHFETAFFALAAAGWLGGMVWKLEPALSLEAWKVLAFPGVFSLAVLIGLGADRILLTGKDPRSPLIWGSALLVLLAAGAALVLGPAEARGRVLVALVVLLPFFLLRVRWMGALCGTALAFFLFVDLRDASGTIYQHPYRGGGGLDDSLPALREAEALALGERVLTLPVPRPSALPANVGLLLGIPVANGAYWPLTVEQARWWNHLNPHLARVRRDGSAAAADEDFRYAALLNYMGVRVIIGERNLPWMDAPPEESGVSLQYLRTMGRLHIWRNDAALPRVRLLRHWRPVADGEAALAALLDPDFPAATHGVVESQGSGWRDLSEMLPPAVESDGDVENSAGSATVRYDGAETLVIDVETASAGLLVVADTHAPGWRAHVDGKRAPILKVNGLFRGVAVPPGAQVVQFSYAPVSVTLGLLLSGGTFALCLLWMAREALRWTLAALRGTPPPVGRDLWAHNAPHEEKTP